MDERSNVFSSWFESLLIAKLGNLFDRFIELSKQYNEKGFIKRENALKYYDDISEGTLIKYENMGLKRYQPIAKGTVFYSREELNKFMLRFEIK